jgi:hypothetical protein
MDRPLWRMVVPLAILAFALQRGAVAAMLLLSDAPRAIGLAAALQVLALVALALAIFLGRSWAVVVAIGFALSVAATAALQVTLLGPAFLAVGLAQSAIAALGAIAVAWLARNEFHLEP